MKNILLVISLFSILISDSFSQQCKTDVIRNQNILKDSTVLDRLYDISKFTESFTKNYVPSRSASVVTLPVVIHVLYRNSTENISTAQINSQLTVLNNDFRKLNSNFTSTPSAFQSIAADCEIEFCLATIDPSGNPTTGITRTSTTVSGIGNTNNWYSTSNGGKDSWDVTKYINIWVCDLGSGGLLGFATIPGSAVPASSDGLVIGYQYFGTTGTASSSSPNHLGRTVTHEMGHYFNLEHVWGNIGGCSDDDFVGDTPNQDQSSGGCPTFPEYDACTASGNGINYNNYLDYSDDICMTMFTTGQKVRMLAALNGPRSSLKNSNACSGSSSINDLIRTKDKISIFPNPANSFLTIEVSSLKTTNDIKIIDVLGKELMSFSMKNSIKINVSNLPQGIYFITSNESGVSNKLIITK